MPAGWAAAIAGIASLGGAALQADAAGDAAGDQSQATGRAVDVQREQYYQTRADTAPWRDTGAAATRRIGELLGLQPNRRSLEQIRQELEASGRYGKRGRIIETRDFEGTPVWQNIDTGELWYDKAQVPQQIDERGLAEEAGRIYGAQEVAGATEAPLNRRFTTADFYNDPVTQLSLKYGLELGERGLRQNAAAGGMRRSGQTLKALTQFGQDYAGSKAGDSYNRFYADQDRIFNRLSGVAGTGQTATVNTAALGANTANNIGGLVTAGANARGAAGIAGANAWAGAGNNMANWYQQQQYINALNNRNRNNGTTSSGGGGGSFGGYSGFED